MFPSNIQRTVMLHSNGYSLVHGLLHKNRAAKYIVMKEESLHNFLSFFSNAASNVAGKVHANC
jgi:phosphoribosylaminoimidazole (AIR) synthetase